MSVPAPPIRFGFFEVDTQSGELRRQGYKVSLQDQPFQALMLLLERPGEVVTREELRQRLWPENTFVDFERGLNKAINKLRVALRDKAAKPRYIENLPRRGYRFIAAIESADPAENPAAVKNAGSAESAAAVKNPGSAESAAAVEIAAPAESAAPARGPRKSPRIDSLAVLPLDNLSGDPGEEYFSDGMTEELICAVARIHSLRVISRTSAMMYKGARQPLPEIARQLRVDAVVEGSVLRVAQKVRITAQLIYAPEDRHLWAGRYERDLQDILLLQSEIAQAIADEIHKVVDPEQADPARPRQVHPRAYEARLKGIFFRDKMTPGDLEKSVEFFTAAVALDPDYAQAHGDLSQAYYYLGLFGVHPPAEMFSKARTNAETALRLDETVAAAHNALAIVHILQDWDWGRAEAESRRAVELSPGQSVTHAQLADYLSITAQHDKAIEEFHRVLELDPISRVYLAHFGLILYRARRHDEAIAQCRKALEVDPDYANALWFMALSLEQKGELAESIAKLEKAVSVSKGRHYQALLARAYALAGERQKALDILGKLLLLSHSSYVSPLDIAIIYMGLADLDSAFHWLEQAYRQRVFRIIELTMPMFDHLRSDPRWQDLVRRIGLPEC